MFILFSVLDISSIKKQNVFNDNNSNRALVAIKIESKKVLLIWRCQYDDYQAGFDIYRNNKKINDELITKSTCFIDSNVNFNINTKYLVKKIKNGKEVESFSTCLMLEKDYIEIPLTKRNNYFVHHIWPGDLDGDGNFDFVVSRLPRNADTNFHPLVEAYLLNGKHLWTIDMGPLSIKKLENEGSNDAPAASISGYGNVAGYRDNDNITVYDINNDGIAEVFIRTADGVVFGDSTILETNIKNQFISVINGQTGKEIYRLPVPDDYKNDGPLGGNFGIAYLDGHTPSLVTKFVNRRSDKKFNCIICAYDWIDATLKLKWKWKRNENNNAQYFHQIRIIDVDGDGRDDICSGNFVIDSYGKLLYIVDSTVHGDRFHITDINVEREGLEGFAIQQTENGVFSNFSWYYYDASNGKILLKSSKNEDVGRGIVGDIDPRFRGYEFWANDGIYNSYGVKISENMPPVNLRIWWDGDLLDEILDKTSIYKWDYINKKSIEIRKFDDVSSTLRNVPPFYGDILGDWREEIVYETKDHKFLRIFISTENTENKLINPLYNRAYRLCFTTHGYYQSNLLDYFIEK